MRTWVCLGLIALTVVGCAPERGPAAPTPDEHEPTIVDARSGRPVGWDPFMADLMRAEVVYVGEQHADPRHHAVQADLVRALHARDPSLAIGLEMIQRPFQPALDAWVAGRIDEAELLERTEWQKRWGFDFALYLPILAHARAHGLPLIALNAPGEVTRRVARKGLDGLGAEQRAALPELDLGDDEHRALVRDALAGHGDLDEQALEQFYAAQVIWDETMAQAVAAYRARPDAAARMVVLAGAMHVLRPAIPLRAARRGARPQRIVLPVDEAEVEAHLEQPEVHYLWVLSR
ncbi:MAG: ChaN family lipoprotein [Myxococcota bacterium]